MPSSSSAANGNNNNIIPTAVATWVDHVIVIVVLEQITYVCQEQHDVRITHRNHIVIITVITPCVLSSIVSVEFCVSRANMDTIPPI